MDKMNRYPHDDCMCHRNLSQDMTDIIGQARRSCGDEENSKKISFGVLCDWLGRVVELEAGLGSGRRKIMPTYYPQEWFEPPSTEILDLRQQIEILKQQVERRDLRIDGQAEEITRLQQSRKSLREHIRFLQAWMGNYRELTDEAWFGLEDDE